MVLHCSYIILPTVNLWSYSKCISRMTASEHSKTGEVVVEYIKTHTNHKPGEVKYVPLSEVTRQEVRNKYADGVKLDKIIDGKWFTSLHTSVVIIVLACMGLDI